MCVIIDTNVAFLVFSQPPDPDFRPVFKWLHDRNKDGILVYGGKLAGELAKRGETRRYVVELNRAGRARFFPDEALHDEESAVRRTGLCESNDPHVIALARLSGARTLCSDDKNLWKDFRNLQLISKPGGRIYQNAGHVKLLRHTPSCGQNRRRR